MKYIIEGNASFNLIFESKTSLKYELSIRAWSKKGSKLFCLEGGKMVKLIVADGHCNKRRCAYILTRKHISLQTGYFPNPDHRNCTYNGSEIAIGQTKYLTLTDTRIIIGLCNSII